MRRWTATFAAFFAVHFSLTFEIEFEFNVEMEADGRAVWFLDLECSHLQFGLLHEPLSLSLKHRPSRFSGGGERFRWEPFLPSSDRRSDLLSEDAHLP